MDTNENNGLFTAGVVASFRPDNSLAESLNNFYKWIPVEIRPKTIKAFMLELLTRHNACTAMSNRLDEVNNELRDSKAPGRNPPSPLTYAPYLELKTTLERELPRLFAMQVESIPVTDEEMLRLLVDYCLRDPSKEFPFPPLAKEIFERYKKENGNEQGPNTGGGEQTAGTDSGGN